MTNDWLESRREFERMRERHRSEIERVMAEMHRGREEFEARMAKLRAEMAAAKAQFAREVARGADHMEAVRKYRDRFGAWPETRWPRKRRGSSRGFEGGEPVPVEPRPKPKPLTDGAEAPVD
jgi:hypothetical protein